MASATDINLRRGDLDGANDVRLYSLDVDAATPLSVYLYNVVAAGTDVVLRPFTLSTSTVTGIITGAATSIGAATGKHGVAGTITGTVSSTGAAVGKYGVPVRPGWFSVVTVLNADLRATALNRASVATVYSAESKVTSLSPASQASVTP